MLNMLISTGNIIRSSDTFNFHFYTLHNLYPTYYNGNG